MRRVRRTTPELRLELTPLIDVVFLLLTFFVFAMVLMVRAEVLGVDLPEIAAGEAGERAEMVTVTLDAEGRAFVDGEETPVEVVAAAVARARDAKGGAEVLIAVDEGARAGTLVEVADALTAAGITAFGVLGTPTPATAPGGGS